MARFGLGPLEVHRRARWTRFLSVKGRLSITLAGAILLALPLSAAASAQEFPDAAFEVRGSNGFDVTVFATRLADGAGTITLIAQNDRSAAIYRTGATVTDSSVKADLGELGQIAVRSVRTGRKSFVATTCDGKRKHELVATRYEGTIEFLGEEGFTGVNASAAPFDYSPYLQFACAQEGSLPAGGPLPGARLDIHRLPEKNELMLRATQKRPSAATTLSVQVDETREGLEITRALDITARSGSGAFGFDSGLRRATLSPPAPFTGHATFHRTGPPSDRWTGNLTVDLPGDAAYPLTGPALRVSLVRPRA